HLVDLQRAHDFGENRDPARDDRRAVGAEPRQLELFDALGLAHRRDDFLERRARHAGIDETERVRDVARRAHGSRGADRAAPPAPAKRRGARAQLEADREPSAVEALVAQAASLEMLSTEADAAHRKAFEVLRLVTLADDELRASAADIDDEVR